MVVIAACKSEPKPVPISSDDMCAFCKMAISEKKFAAEFLTSDGEAIKFDDLGCMKSYLTKHIEDKPAAYFVMDFTTKEWLVAPHAFYVQSSELQTPMGGGVVAFQNENAAKEQLKRTTGELWTFQQYLQSPVTN